ncbi:hypothetical protein D3C74_408820 [compost metagenome]
MLWVAMLTPTFKILSIVKLAKFSTKLPAKISNSVFRLDLPRITLIPIHKMARNKDVIPRIINTDQAPLTPSISAICGVNKKPFENAS